MLKITRRKFLGSAVAAGVCSRLAIAQEEKLRIGVTDWNLNLGANPDAVPLAAKLGFDGVQISFGRKLVDDKMPTDNPEVIAGMPLLLRARLAWAHDWVSNPSMSAIFESLPGSNFVVNGAALPSDSALTSVGAELFITPRLTFLAKFDGEFAPMSQTYAGSGTLRYVW